MIEYFRLTIEKTLVTQEAPICRREFLHRCYPEGLRAAERTPMNHNYGANELKVLRLRCAQDDSRNTFLVGQAIPFLGRKSALIKKPTTLHNSAFSVHWVFLLNRFYSVRSVSSVLNWKLLRRRVQGHQTLIAHQEPFSPPGDGVAEKADRPDSNRDQLAQRQQPQVAQPL